MRIVKPLVALLGLTICQNAMAADMATYKPTIKPLQKPDPKWFVHVGPGGVFLNESARMTVGGAGVPGATLRIDAQLTPVVEGGYFITPEWAVSFTGGLPPKITIRGAGTAGGFGVLGKAVYGPMTLTTHYHLRNFGPIQPYIGGGLAYMKIFDTTDGALQNLKVKDTFGPALQIGADIMINENWGAFIDVKKAFLRTKATGTLLGLPASAKVTLDPTVVHTGVAYRF